MSTPTIVGEVVSMEPTSALRLGQRTRIAAVFTGAAAILLCFVHFGFTGHAFVGAFFAAVLVYLTAFDLAYRRIPNRVVLPASAVVLAAQIALYPQHSGEWLAAAAGAGGCFLVILLLYPPGLGMGDVKLAFLLGAALGSNVIGAALVGTLAAAVFGAALMIRQGGAARRQTIAFGPFLALGGIVALLLS